MKYKNKRIRKIYISAAALAAVGAVLCIVGVLFFVLAFCFAQNAVSNVRPMGEILATDENHAARPAHFDISCEPIKAAEAEDETYYLITDGSDYHLCGMTQESYDRVMAEYSRGDMRIEGVTKVIIDEGAREEAAAFLSEYFGRSITAETMDEYVGDVHIRATEITTAQMVKEIYILYIAFGVPILIFAMPALGGGLSRLSMYKCVKGTGEVSAETVDAQANAPESIWFEWFKVYLAPSYIIGLSNGITALRYDEIKRVYADKASAQSCKLMAAAADGVEYVLSEALYSQYLEEEIGEEKRRIIEVCKERNPDIDG